MKSQAKQVLRFRPFASFSTALGMFAGLVGGVAVFAQAQPRAPLHPSSVNETDQVKLATVERGDPRSPAVVFIHGFLSSKEVWQKQLNSATLSSYHLVAYDWRGSGQSDQPAAAGAYTDFQRWAQDLDAVIHSTNAKKPVLVGWSMGSNIVLDYLKLYGDANIAGVVLIGSSLNVVDPKVQAAFAPAGQTLLRALFDSNTITRQAADASFVRALTWTAQEPRLTAQLVAAAATVPLPVRAALATQPAIDQKAVLATLKVPVWFVQGAHDAFLTPAMLPLGAELVSSGSATLFAHSGHAPQLDEPELFNAELSAFRKKLP